MDPAEFHSKLDQIIRTRIDGGEGVVSCDRLSGGASQETYRLVLKRGGAEEVMALRRAVGGVGHESVGGGPGINGEARLFELAKAAGVPEPEIHYVLCEDDGLGFGFIMEWLDGEALGARIARAPDFEETRKGLAFQCGEILARIHAIEVGALAADGTLERLTPEAYVARTWDSYKAFETHQPMIDFTGRWLMENLPHVDELCLVHNDFRNGNFMVRPGEGVVAVLDWELAHIGDPMRDLGWLCTNSWRFGVTENSVGGFGAREDLFAGYESVRGRKVNAEHVKFWEVFGSFWWSIGCLGMANHYRDGPDASVERPAIGRRSSECQVDCANLLIPGPVKMPEGDPQTLSSNMPRSDELLSSVRDFLRHDVMAETKGRVQFLSRVAANAVDMVVRELALGPAHRAWQEQALAQLLGHAGRLEELLKELSLALRDGGMALDASGLHDFLRQSVVTQVAIDQPKYSGLKTALAGTGQP